MREVQGSGGPGFDEGDTGSLKVASVARGERRLTRGGNAGDFDIAGLDRAPSPALHRGDVCRGRSLSFVEAQHATV